MIDTYIHTHTYIYCYKEVLALPNLMIAHHIITLF